MKNNEPGTTFMVGVAVVGMVIVGYWQHDEGFKSGARKTEERLAKEWSFGIEEKRVVRANGKVKEFWDEKENRWTDPIVWEMNKTEWAKFETPRLKAAMAELDAALIEASTPRR